MTNNRSQQYQDGQRNALKWAAEWLHIQADEMDDPDARKLLNLTAATFGTAKEAFLLGEFTLPVGEESKPVEVQPYLAEGDLRAPHAKCQDLGPVAEG
jgi:hypothetical protein